MKKRLISTLLALTLVLCMIPFGVAAEEPEMVYITASDDSSFITDQNGQPLACFAVEIAALEAIDLNNYGLDAYIYDADWDGEPEITALHLFIYVLFWFW